MNSNGAGIECCESGRANNGSKEKLGPPRTLREIIPPALPCSKARRNPVLPRKTAGELSLHALDDAVADLLIDVAPILESPLQDRFGHPIFQVADHV